MALTRAWHSAGTMGLCSSLVKEWTLASEGAQNKAMPEVKSHRLTDDGIVSVESECGRSRAKLPCSISSPH